MFINIRSSLGKMASKLLTKTQTKCIGKARNAVDRRCMNFYTDNKKF